MIILIILIAFLIDSFGFLTLLKTLFI